MMPDGELKLPKLVRDFTDGGLRFSRAEGESTRVELSFSASSETPVERWFGTEILSHEKGAIRMARVDGGAVPILFNHNWDDPIGMADSARLADGRLEVVAHLFDTERGKEVAKMIEGGFKNVSVGYQIHTIEEDVKKQEYRATDWEPIEFSIVSVPADPTIGVDRANDVTNPVRVIRAEQPAMRDANTTAGQPAEPKGKAMSEVATAPAGAPAETRALDSISAVAAEKERRTAIENIGQANKIDSRVIARWIQEGTPLTKVASEVLDVMEERGKNAPAVAAQLGLSDKETKQYSLFRAIRALHYGPRDPRVLEEAAFELECSRAVTKKLGLQDRTSIRVPAEVLTRPMSPESMQRAMATTPGSKGGYLVNVENMGFIDILRNRSVGFSMGARRLDGLVGNVTFARQTGKPSVTWQGGEGVSVTAADQALGQLSMTPKTAIVITDVSEQLLAQSNPSAEDFIMADLAADIAIDGVDYAIINGTGGSQPLGIKNTTGITSGQDASSATYAKILAFITAAGAQNAIRANPGFVTNITGASVLAQKQRFSSTDTPLWEGNLLDGSMCGFRAMSSEQLASGNIIFGSWGEVVVGSWGVLELAMDTGGTRFNQFQVGIRASWMVDVMVRYPQAFTVSTSLSA